LFKKKTRLDNPSSSCVSRTVMDVNKNLGGWVGVAGSVGDGVIVAEGLGEDVLLLGLGRRFVSGFAVHPETRIQTHPI
jgi:hypothetical protein